MNYLKPVVIASTMLAAGLAFAGSHHQNTMTNHNKLAEVMGHNSVRTNVSTTNWTNRVSVGGLLNVEAGYANHGYNPSNGMRRYLVGSFNEENPHSHDIYIKNANLLVDAKVNHYTNAHVGLVYSSYAGHRVELATESSHYGSAYGNFAGSGLLYVDEAYVTISDFAHNPFFFQFGKEFTPFGNYDPFAQTFSLTQLLAESNETVARLGYVGDNGMNGSVWATNGDMSGPVIGTPAGNASSRIRNFGANLGYRGAYSNFKYAVTLGYVQDIRDAMFIAQSIEGNNNAASIRAGGMSVHGELATGPFYFDANYVGATGNIGRVAGEGFAGASQTGTRIWALELNGDYAFNAWGYDSHVRLGYQKAGQADVAAFHMPRVRYLGDYTIHVTHNTDITAQYVHNEDFKNTAYTSDTSEDAVKGTDNDSNVASIRVGVRF